MKYFETPEQIKEEIEQGLLEYLADKESPYADLAELFNDKIDTENKLDRQKFENQLNQYIADNFDDISKLMNTSWSWEEHENSVIKFIESKKITNKDFWMYGIGGEIGIKDIESDEYINENNDYNYSDSDKKPRFNDKGYYSPDTKKTYIANDYLETESLFTAAFLKENIRKDSKIDAGARSSEFSQRFFYKPEKKYLNENDWGMHPYGSDVDVENIDNFKSSVINHFRRLFSNLSLVNEMSGSHDDLKRKWIEENNPENIQYISDWNLPDDERDAAKENNDKLDELKKKGDIYATNIKTRLLKEKFNDPEIQNLIFDAVPSEKFFAETRFRKYPEIERFLEEKISVMTNEEKVAYVESEEFNNFAESHIFSNVYRNDNLGEKVIAFSNSYNAPIIFESESSLKGGINSVLSSYRVKIKKEVVDAHDQFDSEFWTQYSRIVNSDRGGESCYAFGPEEFYDIYKEIKTLGPKVFSEIVPDIFNDSKYYNSPQSDKLLYFYSDISWMENDRIKKELWHAKSLFNHGLMDYFYEKQNPKPETPEDYRNYIHQQDNESDEDFRERLREKEEYETLISRWNKNRDEWLDGLNQNERKDLFFKGKQIHWVSRMIRGGAYDLNNPAPESFDDQDSEKWFYRSRADVINNVSDWSKYDLEGLDVEKIKDAVQNNSNILFSFLDLEDQKNDISLVDILPIIDLMNEGVDMRGIALAYNKKEYAEYILSGNSKNTLDEVLKTWPEKLKENIKDSEFELYYEYANDYLMQDPKGMIRYAEFLNNKPEISNIMDGEISKKSHLDFRLALSTQTDQVVNWYISGAEYVGSDAMQDYFMRFNSTRESNNKYADFHDALYWIDSIKNVNSEEAKMLLKDTDSMDEARELKDFISRYNSDSDPFKSNGEINSIRELKKRVMAIEANIDLSSIDERVLDITSAPGFNLKALEKINKTPEFRDLIEGKYDTEQPFVPYKKIYTQIDTEDLLKSGLGSWKDKIKGEANNPKKLFKNIKDLIKGRTIEIKNANGEKEERQLEVKDLFENIPSDLNEDILQLLKDQFINIGPLFEAEVMSKSNPDGWVCGDYTDCCMSFGEDKNNNTQNGYMFNKSTQYFTVKLNNRIIAQSVIVDSIDTRDDSDVIILDNIEVAPNYTKNSPMLSKIYNDFWNEYTNKPVKIGTGYSDLTPTGASLEDNVYKHKNRLPWSDSTHNKIFNLKKTNSKESIEDMITVSNIDKSSIKAIVKMEEEVYPDGAVQGKSQVEEVIEKQRELEIPGAASSFIIKKGKENAGYLLMLPEKSEIDGKAVIHINDMVVMPKFQNGKISKEMLRKVFSIAKAYRESEGIEGIEFEARESTSYALLNHPRIQRWIKSEGFKMTSNELLPKYLDNEDYYYVRLDFVE